MLGQTHAAESEVLHGSRTLIGLSDQNLAALQPSKRRYEQQHDTVTAHEPEGFFSEPVMRGRDGPIGLLRDLQDVLMLATLVQSTWTIVEQGARSMKDEALKATCATALRHNDQQCRWLRMIIEGSSPQALMMAT